MAKKKLDPCFQVKISSCGTNYANGTYDIFKGKKAIVLLRSVMVCIAKAFVGRERAHELICWTSLSFLQDIDKTFNEKYPTYTKKKIEEMINESFVITGLKEA